MYYHITIHAIYSNEPDNPSVTRTHGCLTWREMVCELYRLVRVTRDLFEFDTGHRAIVYVHEAIDGIQAGALVNSFNSWSMADGHHAERMLDDLIAHEHQALEGAVKRDGKPSMQELYEAGELEGVEA